MSASKMWVPWAVKLHTATAQSGGAVYVEGIRSLSKNPGLGTGLEAGDGSVYPSFGGLYSGNPRATFSTSDLKALIDELSTYYMLIDSGVNPGVELYEQRMASGGTRDAHASTTHMETTIGDGMLILRSLEMRHQQTATATAEILAISADGSTHPFVYTEASALPTGINPAVDVAWTLGKVDLNGTQLEGVTSVSIDFGVQAVVEASDSDVYPTFVSIRSIRPSIRITSNHPDFTSTLTEAGLYYSSGVVVYARKRTEGGTYVADGTAQHLSFTLGKARADVVDVAGDPRAMSVLITPWDTPGGTAPLTINTATAIT